MNHSQTPQITDSPVIVALDFDSRLDCFQLVDQLDPKLCRLKVGKELFTRFGPELVSELQQQNFDVFLDLKFHDIPVTVAKAVKAAADLGVWMVNVHASGGTRMLSAAKEALSGYAQPPFLIAVTVLTSMEGQDLKATGVDDAVDKQVLRLAELTLNTGLDGLVCSAWEAKALKARFGKAFKLITPGIRLNKDSQDDQRRIMTPTEALNQGSDYLVVGRPITQSETPLKTLETIVQSVSSLSTS